MIYLVSLFNEVELFQVVYPTLQLWLLQSSLHRNKTHLSYSNQAVTFSLQMLAPSFPQKFSNFLILSSFTSPEIKDS